MSPDGAPGRTGGSADPVTYEVVRNRLEAITEEMRIALQQVSGSTTVTEASDFFTGLFLADGTFATMGYQVAKSGPTVSMQIQHLLEHRADAIEPGDMFVGNDPYVGALHQNDVQMAAPIHHDGELVAWAGVMAHETDVGGMDFASWSPEAEEVYQEGLRIPGVKLVDADGVREDVLELILGASRLPDELGLDLRAFVATLTVARDRVAELVDRYGVETLTGVMDRVVEDTAAATGELLASLPDGRVHVTDFLEHDGHENRLYEIDVVMEKAGGELRLDFGGSSEQAPGFVNTTRSGLHAGVACAMLTTVGFDVPWNQGVLGPVEIEAPDGLICTAQHPAPVGAATVEACWVIDNAVSTGLNTFMACTDEHRDRARAASQGAMATFNLGGVDDGGESFGFHFLDPIAGGLGATTVEDGIEAGGAPTAPKPRIADVERNEQRAPIRYLHRRLARDSAGAGRRRGGLAAEMAVHVHGAPTAEGLVMTHGAEVPNATGLFGGHPGATIRQRFGRDALGEDGAFPAEALPEDPADLGGDWSELGPKPGRFPMAPADVFAVSWQGGGGVADPIDREPETVAADVREGRTSRRVAREVYGVELDGDGRVDADATAARRLAIREDRVGAPVDTTPDEDPADHRIGPTLRLVATGDGWEVRTPVGHVLAEDTTAWRAGAVAEHLAPEDLAAPVRLHEELALTAFYCPTSGTLLSIDVHRADTEPADDVFLDLDALEPST